MLLPEGSRKKLFFSCEYQCGLMVLLSDEQLWATTGNGLHGPKLFACDMLMAYFLGLGKWILRSKGTLSSGFRRLLYSEMK